MVIRIFHHLVIFSSFSHLRLNIFPQLGNSEYMQSRYILGLVGVEVGIISYTVVCVSLVF